MALCDLGGGWISWSAVYEDLRGAVPVAVRRISSSSLVESHKSRFSFRKTSRSLPLSLVFPPGETAGLFHEGGALE